MNRELALLVRRPMRLRISPVALVPSDPNRRSLDPTVFGPIPPTLRLSMQAPLLEKFVLKPWLAGLSIIIALLATHL